MINQTEQISLKDYLYIVIQKLNYHERERLRKDGYTNECFFNKDGSLTEGYEITLKEKKKYFYIDFGGSGGFMVLKEDIKTKYYEFEKNTIFNIKGYGTPNFKKHYGSVFNLNIELLHKLRHDYRR